MLNSYRGMEERKGTAEFVHNHFSGKATPLVTALVSHVLT